MCPQFTQLFAVDYDGENDVDRDHHGGHDDDDDDEDDNEWK